VVLTLYVEFVACESYCFYFRLFCERTPHQQLQPLSIRTIEFLQRWMAENSDMFDAVMFVSSSSALEVDEHINLCVKLCKMVYIRKKVVFTVWDGTIPSVTGELIITSFR
jgi:hypothetical protein